MQDDQSNYYFKIMKTKHKRETIIEKAAELFHHLGYHNTGINQILSELNIPKGSFYNYFESKEALAVAVIEYHIEQTKLLFETSTAGKESLQGLSDFFNLFFQRIEAMEYLNGCPIGNMMTELADLNEPVRLKLLEWIEYLESAITKLLQSNHPISEQEARELASFTISAFEGVIMKAKVEKSSHALHHFNKYIIQKLLKSTS